MDLCLRSSGGSGSASGHAVMVHCGPTPSSLAGRCDRPQVCCHSIGPGDPGPDAGRCLDVQRLACSENETSGASACLERPAQRGDCHGLVGRLSAPSCDGRPPMGGLRLRFRVAGPMLPCLSGQTQRRQQGRRSRESPAVGLRRLANSSCLLMDGVGPVEVDHRRSPCRLCSESLQAGPY